MKEYTKQTPSPHLIQSLIRRTRAGGHRFACINMAPHALNIHIYDYKPNVALTSIYSVDQKLKQIYEDI